MNETKINWIERRRKKQTQIKCNIVGNEIFFDANRPEIFVPRHCGTTRIIGNDEEKNKRKETKVASQKSWSIQNQMIKN